VSNHSFSKRFSTLTKEVSMGVRTVSLDAQEEPSQVEKIDASASKLPRGIPYIIGNEAAERFSYYGMRTILIIFMTRYLVDRSGVLATMSDENAKGWYHIFMMANYFFPIFGAFLSDIVWGKYKTIMWLSVVYCLGHLALAMDETRVGLTLGLTLISLGSCFINTSVSAHFL
jgi:POT family proton-dependent oligopeptide transporter